MTPSFWPSSTAQVHRVNQDGSSRGSGVKEGKRGFEHSEASLKKQRGLWTRISNEARVLQKERNSGGLGNSFAVLRSPRLLRLEWGLAAGSSGRRWLGLSMWRPMACPFVLISRDVFIELGGFRDSVPW